MCTNQKLIFNKYMRYPMYVKCGHCKSCLQEKANARQRRIRNTEKKGLVCLLTTLTYSRGNAPYVLRDEAYSFSRGDSLFLNVYRDTTYRKVRNPKVNDAYFQSYKIKRGRHIIETIEFTEPVSLFGTKDLRHEFGKIGVCYYKDYQGFLARVRLYIKRHYGKDIKLFVYACSEYGTKSYRPHFHLLIFCDNADKEIVKDAIYESWPFSNLRRFERSVEEAFNASSYVASYVNSGSKFPLFFKTYLNQKHSYSKGFGLNYRMFTLDKILEKFQQGSFRYTTLKNIGGVLSPIDVPYPAYVIHRYFPKFKGYSRLSPSTLVENMLRFGNGENPYVKELPFYWTDEESHKISVCLNNAYKRFINDVSDYKDISFMDYCCLHKCIWNCFNSTLLRFQMEDASPLHEHFDNLGFYRYEDGTFSNKGLNLFSLNGIDTNSIVTCNPNEFASIVCSTQQNTDFFNDHIKHRDVRNTVYLQDDTCEL